MGPAPWPHTLRRAACKQTRSDWIVGSCVSAGVGVLCVECTQSTVHSECEPLLWTEQENLAQKSENSENIFCPISSQKPCKPMFSKTLNKVSVVILIIK